MSPMTDTPRACLTINDKEIEISAEIGQVLDAGVGQLLDIDVRADGIVHPVGQPRYGRTDRYTPDAEGPPGSLDASI